MKRYIFALFFIILACSADAQISGIKGRKHCVSIVIRRNTIAKGSIPEDTSLYKNSRFNPLASTIFFDLAAEKAIGRKTGLLFHTRITAGGIKDIGDGDGTGYNFSAIRYQFYQVGIEIVNYAQSRSLAPMGESVRWGVNYNIMPYRATGYRVNPSNENITAGGETSGVRGFWSLSWQYNYRRHIKNNLCFEVGFGLELPFFGNKDFIGQNIRAQIITSRLLNIGLSYLF